MNVRRPAAIGAMLAAVAVLAGAATGARTSDIYITGKVLGRVASKNTSLVQITWAYKCLGDKLGDATYEWTLKVLRNQPLPKTTTTIGRGTSKRGSKTVQLGPGEYLPFSDPYSCETDRGAGYDKPEVGAPFTVPDYCAWSVSAVRGAVELEHGTAVKAAKAGMVVAPGDALVTPKGGAASITAFGGTGTVALAASSRLEVDAKQCAARGGWLLRLVGGSLTAHVGAAAGAKQSYAVATPNATASGAKGARWRVGFKAGKTTVRARAGRVRVVGRTGAVLLKPGQATTVKG